MTDDLKPGLPVAGSRPQSDAAIALVNEFKADEERLLRKLETQKDATDRKRLSGANPADTADTAEAMRWLAVSRTHFQEGFMALNRAVFQPARVKLPEDEA